jgi:hypothetical protein
MGVRVSRRRGAVRDFGGGSCPGGGRIRGRGRRLGDRACGCHPCRFTHSRRQIGTATGLAILGSIGAGVTLASWHHQASTFPAAGQRRAAQVGTEVAGGQVRAAAAYVGGHANDPAVASFLQGFEFALLVAGAVLAAARDCGLPGLAEPPEP